MFLFLFFCQSQTQELPLSGLALVVEMSITSESILLVVRDDCFAYRLTLYIILYKIQSYKKLG